MAGKKKKKPKTKLLIIGSKKYKKSTVKMLLEEGRKKFDSVVFAPVHKIRIIEEKGESKLYYKEKNLKNFDIVYPRLSSLDFFMAEPILQILSKSKAYCPVSLKGFQVSNNKYLTIKSLTGKNVPITLTSLSISPKVVKQTVESFGFPVVLKLISGFAGKGVMLVNREQELQAILDTVHLFEHVVSAQKFIESKGTDLRCYVTGNKVITVERKSAGDDFRANISRGGSAKQIKTSPELEKIALTVSKSLNMDICAVDFIKTSETKEGFIVIEINFVPGPFRKFLGNKIVKDWINFLHSKIETA